MKNERQMWKIVAILLFSIYVIACVVLISMVGSLDMLPAKFLAIIAIIFVLIGLITFYLLFVDLFKKKSTGKSKYITRTVGAIISIGFSLILAGASVMVWDLKETLHSMIAVNDTQSSDTLEEMEQVVSGVQLELETESEEETEEGFNITKDPFIVYVGGSDTRTSKLTEKYNSDVNILVMVNPTTKQIFMINTPRDYYIKTTKTRGNILDKLTHCGSYGIECSLETLENLYDQEINYYTMVNFKGFSKLIDAIGGVDVYCEKSFKAHTDDIYFKKGNLHLNGRKALAFVRERYAFSDGDYARGRHQMEVIEEVIHKLASGTIITKYTDILESVEGMFALGFTNEEISALVKMQLSDMASWDIKMYTVTGEGARKETYSMPGQKVYVTIPDYDTVEHAKSLMQMVFDDKVLTDADLVMGTQESEQE